MVEERSLLRQLAFALVASVVLLVAATAALGYWQSRELDAATLAQGRILAALQRGERPADADFVFRRRSGVRGVGAPPLTVESLSRGLRAGPWRYPGIVSSDTNDPDAPVTGPFVPPATRADLELADGRRVEVRTRRRGTRWEVEVLTGWGFGQPVPDTAALVGAAP